VPWRCVPSTSSVITFPEEVGTSTTVSMISAVLPFLTLGMGTVSADAKRSVGSFVLL